ncbi:MAG TPA: branched-chain amino acid transaminase [Kofleriaceae bacterium]|nr:branched-chain amino acid transaminase [Kofleriaceae bacterium]
MAIKKVEKIWVDGALVDWDDAQEHVLAHTLHYGLGAFEGVRAYEQPGGRTAIFRLQDHIDRLFESCHICTIDVPHSRKDVAEACLEVLRVNKLTNAYLRPLVYLGAGALGLGTLEPPVRTVVAAFEWGAYLGEEGLKKGIRCKVSGFRRGNVDTIMSKGKICGQYTTSVLAKRDAIKSGYDEAIMLDTQGLVTEGSGENIFVVKNGVIRTPPTSASILAGITRASVMTLCHELGYDLREDQPTRDELWVADEVFFTGTAAEVTPVREIDDRRIGSGEPGPITRRIQDHFFGIVQGKSSDHKEWLTLA